jgi:hypothetical protein
MRQCEENYKRNYSNIEKYIKNLEWVNIIIKNTHIHIFEFINIKITNIS